MNQEERKKYILERLKISSSVSVDVYKRQLVENASSRKSRSEDFISKFARIYTPAVCYAALALAILPPLVRMAALGLPADWGTWIYRCLLYTSSFWTAEAWW